MVEQMDAYDRQGKETQQQLERSVQQQERTEGLLARQERLHAEQERLQKRFAAISGKMGKDSQQMKISKNLFKSQCAEGRCAA